MHDPRENHRERTWTERAGQRCPGCGRPFDDADRADVHHRDGNQHNGAPDNLRKRCSRCHLRDEHDREVDTPASPPRPSRSRPPRPKRTRPAAR